MGVAIAILVVLLIIETAIIFLMWKVLKSTFNNLENILNLSNEYSDMVSDFQSILNIQNEVAYDGKYYPCVLFMSIEFNHPHTEMIADFSLYDSKKIIGLLIKSTSSLDDFIKDNPLLAMYKDTDFEKECHIIVPKAFVYSPMKGVWSWRPME